MQNKGHSYRVSFSLYKNLKGLIEVSLLTKPTALTDQVRAKKSNERRGQELTHAFFDHLEKVSSKDYFDIIEVEELILKEQEHAVKVMKTPKTYPKHLPRFSPSSSDKCERELFLKSTKATKDGSTGHSFQRRWTRNSTAVHGAIQKTLLEAEVVLDTPEFKVMRLDNGLPAWEKNIEGWKVFTVNHQGQQVQFVVFGMCDGILKYKDGSKIGFEYKTKSNSVAQIKQIKEISPSHRLQTVAYSLLFGVDEWLVTYESVAKDKWMTGENARPDFKIFYTYITDEDRNKLLNKWAKVADNIGDGEISKPDFNKCLFCQFKTRCKEIGI